MVIPNVFGNETERIIATYDYKDVESGLGYQTFYAMTTSLAAGTEQVLSDEKEYSSDIYTQREAAGTSSYMFYSSNFLVNKLAKGTALFSCGIAGSGITITARLAKYDGANVTYLSSLITAAAFAGGIDVEKMILLQLPLTETAIKIGESLRLYVTFASTSPATAQLGYDPMGRDGGWIGTTSTSIMQIKIPFKINI